MQIVQLATIVLLVLDVVDSFVVVCSRSSGSSRSSSRRTTGPRAQRLLRRLSSTPSSGVASEMDTSAVYSESDLKVALDALNTDDNECQHIFGYNDDSHKLSMLQTITATVLLDYQHYLQQPHAVPIEELLNRADEFHSQNGPILNLQTVIQNAAPRMALAAEFKRASPSKGDIAVDADVKQQAKLYQDADIISCLTEARWFKGSLDDLTDMRLVKPVSGSRPAVLRKDFVVNRYMIAQAAAAGADTVLLIVAVLPLSLLKDLIDYSRELDMEPLVEVHADSELDVAIAAGARVLGVNNRNLHTFQVDLGTSERVASRLDALGLTFRHDETTTTTPPQYTVCALSGMSTCFDVHRYRQAGLAMCLIGESLMRASDPAAAIASLLLDPADYEKANSAAGSTAGAYTVGTQIVKVCGITGAEDALVACRAGANLIGVIFAAKSKRCVTQEQATEVVNAVRTFGERSIASDIRMPDDSKVLSPMAHLISCSQALVQGCKQRPAVVGVFQNQEFEYIRKMVQECGLDMVQLHGKEGMAAANRANFGVPVIRVVDISVDPETGKAGDDAVDVILESITNDPVAILLDTSIKGAKQGGGTGVAFDWTIAERVQNAGLPVIVAGGLTALTVKDCVGTTRPFGVDVSSGVEKAPGQKDHDKVRDFVQAAKAAAVEASKGF